VAIGLPVLAVPGLSEHTLAGDVVSADLAAGDAINLRTQTKFAGRPLPDRMLAVLAEGGVVAALKRLA
jgi:3-isopropylmalate/(R)-2-methylmalate dehydratase small subunit